MGFWFLIFSEWKVERLREGARGSVEGEGLTRRVFGANGRLEEQAENRRGARMEGNGTDATNRTDTGTLAEGRLTILNFEFGILSWERKAFGGMPKVVKALKG